MTPDKKKHLSNINFSKDAADYDQSQSYAMLRATYSTIADEALNKPFGTVLDIGCGTGALLKTIHERTKDARLFGVDLSEQMIQVAQANLGDTAELRVSDSETLPFPNEAFDLVMCTFSFHHYPNPGTVLLEMRRVLAPKGRLILADPMPPIPLRQLWNFISLFAKDGTVRIYSKREMKALVEAAAIEVFKWRKLNWYLYLLVAGKKS